MDRQHSTSVGQVVSPRNASAQSGMDDIPLQAPYRESNQQEFLAAQTSGASKASSDHSSLSIRHGPNNGTRRASGQRIGTWDKKFLLTLGQSLTLPCSSPYLNCWNWHSC